MGAGLAAGSFFLGGQLRGEQASQMYQQQMQDRMLDRQLKQAQLLGQLQQLQQFNAAKAKLPPDQQDLLTLGGTVGDLQKRQDLAGRVAFTQQRLLGNKTLTPEQKISYLSQLNAGSVGDLEKMLDELEKPQKESAIELFQRDPKGFDAYEQAVHKYAKTPQINVETPVAPGDFTTGPGGASGVYMKGKTGPPTFFPVAGASVRATPDEMGSEATIRQFLAAHPGSTRLDALKAISTAEAKPPAPPKAPGLKSENTVNGWKLSRNPSNGLPYVTGMAVVPKGGLMGMMGGSGAADPKQRAQSAMAQAMANGLEVRRTADGNVFAKGTDGVVYKLTPMGTWVK